MRKKEEPTGKGRTTGACFRMERGWPRGPGARVWVPREGAGDSRNCIVMARDTAIHASWRNGICGTRASRAWGNH